MGYLRVKNIGKAFKRYARKSGRLAEWFGLGVHHDSRWVLRDITFDVESGESVGIVGVNGAGKSTLLKIITGTTRPTTGSVEAGGRISALLELGMGFHPEFTGRQNAYMDAQLRGLTVSEVDDKIREIEDFAEIGDYFDQPMRTYSTGMQVRLAFSVATCVRPEILIVDEALSVGDVYFQHKCMQKIRSFKEAGTTLLFVSHSPEAVRMLCERAILIDGGLIKKNADAASVMDYYRASQVRRCELTTPEDQSDLREDPSNLETRDSKVVLARRCIDNISVELTGNSNPIHSKDDVTVSITASFNEAYTDPHIGFGLRNKMGVVIYEANTYTLGYKTKPVSARDQLTVSFSFPCNLFPGTYELMVGVADSGYDKGSFERSLFFDQSYVIFEVLPGEDNNWCGLYDLQPIVKIQ
jgi:lipopolysaccharide transport system ATP-binding protein